MAASFRLPLVLFISSLFLHAALAEIICEDLPKDVCAFSICSSGQRCILETETKKGGNVEYQCKTSEVVVERMADYIETDECVRACGVDRNVVGISSDALFEPDFAAKLCSPDCYQKCPNIVDLYFNLAAGEGAFLPNLCDVHRSNPHRAMVQLLSSGAGEDAESPLSAPTIASLTAASPDYAPSEGPVSAESPMSATVPAQSPISDTVPAQSPVSDTVPAQSPISDTVPAQSPSSAMTPTASSPDALEEDFEGA